MGRSFKIYQRKEENRNLRVVEKISRRAKVATRKSTSEDD